MARARDEDIISATEVGKLLGLGRNSVYDAAGRGEIPHRRVGRRLIFSRAAILSWLGVAAISIGARPACTVGGTCDASADRAKSRNRSRGHGSLPR